MHEEHTANPSAPGDIITLRAVGGPEDGEVFSWFFPYPIVPGVERQSADGHVYAADAHAGTAAYRWTER